MSRTGYTTRKTRKNSRIVQLADSRYGANGKWSLKQKGKPWGQVLKEANCQRQRIYFVVVLFQASKEIFIKTIAEHKLNEQRIHWPHTPRNIVLCKNNLGKLLNRKLQPMLINKNKLWGVRIREPDFSQYNV